jgi:deoxyribodipyrimidine photolyase
MQVDGVPSLQMKIKGLKKKAQDADAAVVGYTAAYALYVHENKNAHHKEGQQAKFLEGPAREHREELREEWIRVYRRTGSITQSNLGAALLLQRLSQAVVPVDTGFLRSTAFTALEKDLPTIQQNTLPESREAK